MCSTVLAKVMGDVLGASRVVRGFMASCSFIGLGIGGTLSGPLGDGWGRKPVLLQSLLACFAFQILSIFASYSVGTVLLVRLLNGAAIGLGVPAATSLLAENSPKTWRSMILASCSIGFYGLGEIYFAG